MKKTEGLSANQERLLSILEYKRYKVIKRKNLIDLISRHGVTKNLGYLIKSMLQKRRLISFKRGHYIIVPISSVDKAAEVSEFEINEYFLESSEYYIGLYNAFNLHGFTDQVPNKMFVFNTKYSFDRNILYYRFKYFKIKKSKLFGILKKGVYHYSDKERTIIDALDYPQYLGGMGEVIETIKKSRYNKTKLIDYSIRYGSIKVMKLVGFLTNSNKLFDLLKKKKALTYYTTIKSKENLINKKWKIRMI